MNHFHYDEAEFRQLVADAKARLANKIKCKSCGEWFVNPYRWTTPRYCEECDDYHSEKRPYQFE